MFSEGRGTRQVTTVFLATPLFFSFTYISYYKQILEHSPLFPQPLVELKMSLSLRDLVHCTLNKKNGVVMMVKHRTQGKLDDFEVKKSKLYDIRFDDGSIIMNIEEGCLSKRSPRYRDKLLTAPERVAKNWVRVGDVVLCEKGLGIIRFVGELPASKGM